MDRLWRMEGKENGEMKAESEVRGLSCPMKDRATYGDVRRLESFCTPMPHLHPPCALPGPAEGQEFPQGPSSDSAHQGCLCAPPCPAEFPLSLPPGTSASSPPPDPPFPCPIPSSQPNTHLFFQVHLFQEASRSWPQGLSLLLLCWSTGHGWACLLRRPGTLPP